MKKIIFFRQVLDGLASFENEVWQKVQEDLCAPPEVQTDRDDEWKELHKQINKLKVPQAFKPPANKPFWKKMFQKAEFTEIPLTDPETETDKSAPIVKKKKAKKTKRQTKTDIDPHFSLFDDDSDNAIGAASLPEHTLN